MEAIQRRKLLVNFFISLIFCALLSLGLYYIATKAGVPIHWAVAFGTITFVIYAAALFVGMLRAMKDRNQAIPMAPKMPGPKVLFWLVAGFVVPILALALQLAFTVLIALSLAPFGLEDLPSSPIVNRLALISVILSYASAIAIWLVIWKRHKNSLSQTG
jgi:hypothetical protein